MESYHVMPTHPQSVPVSGYAESQIDIFEDCPNSSRLWTVSVAPISDYMQAMPAQEFADWAAEKTWRETIQLAPGQIYRNALADERRAEVGRAKGKSVDHLTDAEMLDAIQYMIFPNFLPWYGYGVPIAYGFRPNGNRFNSCIMEVYVLAPRDVSQPCPPAPETIWIGENEACASYSELGRLGPIFDQDLANIPGIQRGLEAAIANGRMQGVKLSKYQEARIRHYHDLIGEYVAAAE
jgi:Ring hydroxylating alpha subunit (catalytic domain)